MALFTSFYFLNLHSIEGILSQQGAELVENLDSEIVHAHFDFVREMKLLRLSRGVKKELLLVNDGKVPRPSDWLIEFAHNWYQKIQNDIYVNVTFYGIAQEPVAIANFTKAGQIGTMVYGPVGESRDLEHEDKERVSSSAGDPFPVIARQDSDLTIGSFAKMLQDSTLVLRSVYEIRNKKGGDVIGYVSVDRKLDSILNMGKSRYRDLLIYDWKLGHIVYDSADFDRVATAAKSTYPAFYELTQDIDTEETSNIPRYEMDSRSYLGSASRSIEPSWIVISTIWLDPYIENSESRGEILIVGSILLVLVAGAFIYVLSVRVRHRTEELIRANDVVTVHNKMLEDELHTAHEMQMHLMPHENPSVPGFEIVGYCKPATQVGGDFFQYYDLPDRRLGIALADVTGHGMKAAIPNMVFSGLLDNQIQYTPGTAELMIRLNASLHRVLDRRTFICFSMIELDHTTRWLRIANGGCPYPYHFRASEKKTEEVCVGSLPLGLRPDSTYPVVDVHLEEFDLMVLCSDGVIEATNELGEQFGYDRTAATIRDAGISKLSAHGLMQRLFDDVAAFVGAEVQEDDQTVVVVKALDLTT